MEKKRGFFAKPDNASALFNNNRVLTALLVISSILLSGYAIFLLALLASNQMGPCGVYDAYAQLKADGQFLIVETISLRADNTGTATVFVVDDRILETPNTTSFKWRMRYSRVDKWNVENNVPVKTEHVLSFENDVGSYRQLYWARETGTLYAPKENETFVESQLCYAKR